MIINIGDDILKLRSLKLLNKVLIDKTTRKNILWATDDYKESGKAYNRNREITQDLITGRNADVIKTRARKAMEQQSLRTKQHAEVFTPLWIVKKMNDHADEVWFEHADVFFQGNEPTEHIEFPPEKTWQQYVDSRRMEITCGEGPYLATRYDVESGEAIPIENRIGILDRKLRIVNEFTTGEEDWLKWAYRALEATYGYEFQGDNVLIARVNLLMTFEEYLQARFKRKPTLSEYFQVANIIAWNIWQMDGLAGTIPYCRAEDEYTQLSMFDEPDLEEQIQKAKNVQPHCQIFNWRKRESLEYLTLQEGRNMGMKFDFIIGNPPYQDEALGDNATYAPPIYHLFLEESYKIADKVELIHPARFLFNAGSTPKEWNKKMLSNEHLKVLYYEQDSSKVFSNTDIKGGVAITFHDNTKNFGAIEVFTAFEELNSLMKKVYYHYNFKSFSKIVFTRTAYRLTEKMHRDYPNALSQLSNGHPYDMSTNIFERLPQIFFNTMPNDGHDYIQIIGREDNKRVYKFIRRDYVNSVDNLDKYKIFVPKANGSGALGEVLTTPVIGQPVIGHTESFISIGCFETNTEAAACYKYICSKFARCLLGILKVTQDNPPEKWKYVPLQDFTEHSDIDWTKSVAEIDKQLYAKYGLDETEINFIETHVKEMQ